MKPIDFDIVKEAWDKYELSDGTIVKTRTILKQVFKGEANGKPNYQLSVDNIVTVLVPPNLKGQPSTEQLSHEELQKYIIQKDMRYNTIVEEWNEYVCDDGARIRIKSTLTEVSKTSKFDNLGDPIYLVNTNHIVQVKVPNP